MDARTMRERLGAPLFSAGAQIDWKTRLREFGSIDGILATLGPTLLPCAVLRSPPGRDGSVSDHINYPEMLSLDLHAGTKPSVG